MAGFEADGVMDEISMLKTNTLVGYLFPFECPRAEDSS